MKKSIFIVAIVLLLVFNVSCTQTPQQKPMTEDEIKESSIFDVGKIERVKITSAKAKVRSGFSDRFPVIEVLSKNDRVDVIGKYRNWYVIQLPTNYIGIISVDDAAPVVVEEDDMTKAPDTDEPTPEDGTTPDTDTPADRDDTPDVTGPGTDQPDVVEEPNRVPVPDVGQQDPDRVEPPAPDREPDLNEQPNGLNKLTSQEQQMVTLINNARAENSLPPLKVDLELTKVARIKSQDMIDNDYFSHNSPTYGDPFDMMDDFGIKYVYAGENIAKNSTVQRAHDALMNSSGHRRNILHSKFTHIGIGIKKGGPYGYYTFTQMFISKPK